MGCGINGESFGKNWLDENFSSIETLSLEQFFYVSDFYSKTADNTVLDIQNVALILH